MANFGFLKKALPWIGSAVQIAAPGPLGVLAGILTRKLGTEVPADQGKMGDAITMALGDPAQQEKLKEAELEFQKFMGQLNVTSLDDLATIAATDRASARSREEVIKDWTPRVLACAIIIFAVAIEGSLAWASMHRVVLSADSAVIVGRILGTMDSALTLVLAYYFGSSAGSVAKDKTISDIAKS